jgi:protocatechuate 3,4-dioxygenase beta subunit
MTDRDHELHGRAFTRRQTLGMAGAAGGALALGGVAGKAISELGGSDEVDAAMVAKSCRLTPEVTEGPFYVDLDKVRRDITEGRPGVPLKLKIRVIDVRKCKPIHSAAVDIWHCDAGGLYSDESSNSTAGQTFLRGVQLTDKKGYATIQTVYPGHYTGRATHIHLKVHIGGKARGGALRGGRVSHTGQLFFAESSNSSVYSVAPYSSDTDPRTLNSSDSIYSQAGGSRAEVRLAGSTSAGYVGRIVVGVNPKRTSAAV